MDKKTVETREEEERRSGEDRRKGERRDRPTEAGVLSTRTGQRRRPNDRRAAQDDEPGDE